MILIMMKNRLFVEGQHLIFRRRVLLPPPLIFLLLLLGAYYDHGASAFTPSFVATTPVRGWTTTATTPFTTTTLTPTTPTSLQMVSYEDLMEKLPSKAVIDAVESSSSGGSRVVASDVATKAGVSLSQARKDLTALASISRGDIAVDKTDGELIYSFPNNLSGVLAQNSRKYQALQTFRQVWPTLFWGVRVTFGIALLASLVAIFSTIFFINSSSNRDDRDDRGSNGGGGGLRMGSSWGGFWGPSPFDFFFYRPYGYYGYYGSPSSTSNNRDPEEMSFLESIFSFVFGDGNPNASLEERRLSLAASMIRQNNGAVTAEQLAPFCDDVPNPDKVLNSDSVYVDEGYVLPIVTALDGEPQVTPSGEIVYTFPNLQMSAAEVDSGSSSSSRRIRPGAPSLSAILSLPESMLLKRAGLSPRASAMDIKRLLMYNGISTQGALERDDLLRILQKAMPPPTEREQAQLLEVQMADDRTVLQEREWKFSLASDMNKILSGGLGVVNLGGALYLGNLLGQYALYGVQLPSYFGVVQGLYPLLLAYAILFNVIPLVRNIWNGQQNAKIQERNKNRRGWKEALAMATNSNSPIGKKIAAAKSMGTKMRKLGATKDDVLFDTSMPMEDIQEKKVKSDLDDFDKKLLDSMGDTSGSAKLGAAKDDVLTIDISLPIEKIPAKTTKDDVLTIDTSLPMEEEIPAKKVKNDLNDDFDKKLLDSMGGGSGSSGIVGATKDDDVILDTSLPMEEIQAKKVKGDYDKKLLDESFQ